MFERGHVSVRRLEDASSPQRPAPQKHQLYQKLCRFLWKPEEEKGTVSRKATTAATTTNPQILARTRDVRTQEQRLAELAAVCVRVCAV